jgi:hypothetical protein
MICLSNIYVNTLHKGDSDDDDDDDNNNNNNSEATATHNKKYSTKTQMDKWSKSKLQQEYHKSNHNTQI